MRQQLRLDGRLLLGPAERKRRDVTSLRAGEAYDNALISLWPETLLPAEPQLSIDRSFVSGRNASATTNEIAAMMIGYQSP